MYTIYTHSRLQLGLLLGADERVVHVERKCVAGHAGGVHPETGHVEVLGSELRNAAATDETHVHFHFILEQLRVR